MCLQSDDDAVLKTAVRVTYLDNVLIFPINLIARELSSKTCLTHEKRARTTRRIPSEKPVGGKMSIRTYGPNSYFGRLRNTE